MAKSADSTAKYIEFNKADLSPAGKKLDAQLAEANKVAGKLREQFEALVQAEHGALIATAHEGRPGFDGYEFVKVCTNFGKLSGKYDLPGKSKSKSSSKAISL